MKIVLAADHGGVDLKNKIVDHLKAKKEFEVLDLGTYSSDSVDYPEYGKLAGEKVVLENCFGIVVCGSGIGISIAANKVFGVRCALVHCEEYAKLCRQHNNANMIALGGRFLDETLAINIVDEFLSTEFEGGRHQRRVLQLEK